MSVSIEGKWGELSFQKFHIHFPLWYEFIYTLYYALGHEHKYGKFEVPTILDAAESCFVMQIMVWNVTSPCVEKPWVTSNFLAETMWRTIIRLSTHRLAVHSKCLCRLSQA